MNTTCRAVTLAGLAMALLGVGLPTPSRAADLSNASRAASSLHSSFPELARPPEAPGLPSGTRVDEYVGSDMARLRDTRGHRSVLLSSMPLRSRLGGDGLKPVSLDLVGAGRGVMRPENPVTQVRIAIDPRDGFTIGPDPDHLVTIMPLGIDPTAPDATVFAGQLLFANARPSADLLIRPSVDGVQTFEQLVGPSAPESFAYRLQLAAGQTADLNDGVVTIRQGGKVIVRSLPPVALDADRRLVPIQISLDDDVVRLAVPHRDKRFRYPIAVDPDWSSSYDYYDQPGLGLQGWHADGQSEYYDAFINNIYDPDADPKRDGLGFFIRPIVTGAARLFPIGVGMKLFFNAPGTTHIRSVTYDHVSRFNDRDRQTLRLGLYGGDFGEADDVFEAEEKSTASVTLPRDPFPEGQDTPATSAVMWMYTSPCVAGEDLNCPPVIETGTRTLLKVGSVQLDLTDFDFPSTQATGDLLELQDRWTNTTDTRTIDPSAIDEGSGVRDIKVTVDDAAGSHPLRSNQSPCYPNHDHPAQDNTICPRTLTLDEPLSLNIAGFLEGRSIFTVDASDLADNTAVAGGTNATVSIYLDRKLPATTVSGDLFAANASWLNPRRSSALTVTGTDTASGEGKNSGIAHNHLTAVDEHGATVLDRDADTCTPQGPIEAPCDPGKASTFSVNPRTFPEGTITFTATSSDLAGNESEAISWTVRIDRTAPAARASGDLVGLTSQHTNSTTATSVTLQGRDASSGVARLQLVASNSNGERVLADRDTCLAADIDPDDGSCPHAPSVEVSIDPGQLPDGPTTFIARAIDHAGILSVDNQDWDTYVDHTPPEPPDSVDIAQTSNTSVQVTWPTVVDQPLGSGDVSYEYLVIAGGQPVGGWQPTNNPYAQVGGLPPGVTITVLVHAIDAAANVSEPARGGFTLQSIRPPVEVDSCSFQLAVSSGPEVPLEPIRPANTSVEASFRLTRCDKDVELVTGQICVEEANTLNPRIFNSQITSWFRVACQPFALPSTRTRVGDTQFQEVLCTAGTQNYRAAFRDVHYKVRGAVSYAPAAGASGARILRHNCNEAGAWRFLAYQYTTRPSSRLASTLGRGGLPSDHGGRIPGWEAHHIIATIDNADSAARGFACFADDDAPNSDFNGVWLRGRTQRAAGEGTPPRVSADPNYKRLVAYDKVQGTAWHQRQYHGSLRRPRYYAEVNRRLDAATSARNNWVCDKGRASAIVKSIKRQLIDGDFPF